MDEVEEKVEEEVEEKVEEEVQLLPSAGQNQNLLV